MHSVAMLVGSLRAKSLNRSLAQAVRKLADTRLEFRLLEIGDLPLYNEDLWIDPPPQVIRFKGEIAACDAVTFVVPEYNRGVPAVLSNALDWGSRPYGQGVWDGRPAALMGTSPGAISTAVAQSTFRSQLLVQGMAVMGRPEIYVQHKAGMFDSEGIADEGLKNLLNGWVDKFDAWIGRFS